MALKVELLLLIVCLLLCHYQVTSIENVTNQDDHNKAPVPESVPSKEALAPMKPLHHKKCHHNDDSGHYPDNGKCHHDPSTSLSKTMPMQAEVLSKTPSTEGHGYTCDTVCKDHCKSAYSIDTCSKDCKKCCKESFECVQTPMNKDKKCKKTWDFTLVDGMKTKCP